MGGRGSYSLFAALALCASMSPLVAPPLDLSEDRPPPMPERRPRKQTHRGTLTPPPERLQRSTRSGSLDRMLRRAKAR